MKHDLVAGVVEVLHVLRLRAYAGELLAGAERPVDDRAVSRLLSFVRTKAPPLPGFTCWNSTMRQKAPSSSMCMPFLNWFVLTVSATAAKTSEAQPTVIRSFRKPVKFRTPSAVITTLSSIRIPARPSR